MTDRSRFDPSAILALTEQSDFQEKGNLSWIFDASFVIFLNSKALRGGRSAPLRGGLRGGPRSRPDASIPPRPLPWTGSSMACSEECGDAPAHSLAELMPIEALPMIASSLVRHFPIR